MENATTNAVTSERRCARTQFTLRASQIEFLDRFCARVRRDTGSRFSKRSIIETLIEAMPASLPLREVASEIHLKEALRARALTAGTGEESESEDPSLSTA